MNNKSTKPYYVKYILWGGYLILFLVPLFIITQNISLPGLYYDEAIQAVPAMKFLNKSSRPCDYTEQKYIKILDRPFPVMTEHYMGAIKSQVLIPVFSLFRPSNISLRMTTLIIALIGLLIAMLWVYKNFGLPIALVFGVFLVYDPCFLFISRHDWGSFSLGFLCRCCSLLFITNGWKKQSYRQFFAGGFFLGLGMYNKIDFSVFVIAAVIALVTSSFIFSYSALRTRFWKIVCGIAGFILCILPLSLSIKLGTLNKMAASIFNLPGGHIREWGEKLNVIIAMLDGSYFQRLMLSGGVFESMFNVKAAANPFLIIFVCSMIIFGIMLLVKKKKGSPNTGHTFVLFVTIFTLIGLLLLPRATRIHHMMNVYPFPHLVVAILVIEIFKIGNRTRKYFLCHISILIIILVLAGSFYTSIETLSTINRTGGKGRWSEALDLFAKELKHNPDAVVVSLDWGFNEQLSFVNSIAKLEEPIWIMYLVPEKLGQLTFTGTAQHIYLIYEPEYAFFSYHVSFLNAIHCLAPDVLSINKHTDREGDPAFTSIRILQPHHIIYDGDFHISVSQ